MSDVARLSDDDLYNKAQIISSSFTGWAAADVMAVLAIVTRYAMETHIKPGRIEQAVDDLRDWILGDLD